MLSELESQNDDQVEGMTAKVRMLKDVSDLSGLLEEFSCTDELLTRDC